ncbi:IS701 family transposase [Streptomyces thermovulgaris]|uniref:Transposase n=1 Tax=Streptomyces thermogriseus TaxID=75292 RepID=A0ABN1T0P9_9ACTN
MRGHGDASGELSAVELLDAEFCRRLFGSLQRTGQRMKAERYVRGLLSVSGRKTLRRLAEGFEGASAQQSVHHFITASPWEWRPIRHALARQARRLLAPEAWVIGSTLIPKAGPHSVGADPQPTPLGVVNGQHAVGTWLASEHSVVPVDWQLRLSARWTTDPLRTRAGVPKDVASGSVEECVRQAVAELSALLEAAPLPVVVDVGETEGLAVAQHLVSLGRPFVVRVSPATLLRIDRSVLPRHGNLQRTAGELAESLPHLRQQVGQGSGRTTVVAVPVRVLPSGRGALTLVAEWQPGRRTGRRLWLTNLAADGAPSALRLARLTAVVERDLAEISDRVGLRDFAGRSFPGWHRHITLASVAHLVVAAARHRGPGGPAGPRSDVSHINGTTVR